jgi:hypothetical protein
MAEDLKDWITQKWITQKWITETGFPSADYTFGPVLPRGNVDYFADNPAAFLTSAPPCYCPSPASLLAARPQPPTWPAGRCYSRFSSVADKRYLLADSEIVPGWTLTQAIVLTVERDEDGEWIVTDSFSTVYGNGGTLEKALNDYCQSLVSYFEFLAERFTTNIQTAMAFRSLGRRLRKKKQL